MLSICITVKNRSRVLVDGKDLRLFPNCIESVAKSVWPGLDCEIIVADWQSDDWPCHEWVERLASPVPVRIVQVEGTFSRGHGLNVAATAASGDILLFLDADCLVFSEMLAVGLQHATAGKAFFPILFSFDNPEHTSGWWRDTGYGICMVSTSIFKQTEGWPEYTDWGNEDNDFLHAVGSVADIVRERVDGLFHQWHPDDIEWKNRFGTTQDREELEIKRNRLFVRDLFHTIPKNSSIVLIDESMISKNALWEFDVHPFLERDGEYWGNPPDDTTAISELTRMRSDGADFIVFVEPAFWWLEYYHEMDTYLDRHFPRLLTSDSLVIFDLRHNAQND
jgi:glycosyltransferase involved in cell wall biosynthesis